MDFPHRWPVMWILDVFLFHKPLNKQSSCRWWGAMPPCDVSIMFFFIASHYGGTIIERPDNDCKRVWCSFYQLRIPQWFMVGYRIVQYRRISNISYTLVGDKRVDHSDVGASPVGTFFQWIGQKELQDETRNKFWDSVRLILESWRSDGLISTIRFPTLAWRQFIVEIGMVICLK